MYHSQAWKLLQELTQYCSSILQPFHNNHLFMPINNIIPSFAHKSANPTWQKYSLIVQNAQKSALRHFLRAGKIKKNSLTILCFWPPPGAQWRLDSEGCLRRHSQRQSLRLIHAGWMTHAGCVLAASCVTSRRAAAAAAATPASHAEETLRGAVMIEDYDFLMTQLPNRKAPGPDEAPGPD